MEEYKITEKIIGAAIQVHKALGPGLLESAYRECLAYEIRNLGMQIQIEKPMPIVYKEIKLDHGYRIDILVNHLVVVEVKSVEAFADVHIAQCLTYLKLGNYRYCLLINFNVNLLKNGIRRLINSNAIPEKSL